MKIKLGFSFPVFARISLLTFVVLLLVLPLTGCASTITEVRDLLSDLPVLLAAISTFVGGLAGTISASVVTDTNTVVQDATASAAEASQVLSTFTSSTATSVISKIGTILTSIDSTLSTFLSSLTDISPATQQKIEEIVSIATTAVSGVIALLPLFATKVALSLKTGSLAPLKLLDKTSAATVKGLHNGMKDTYKAWREEPSTDSAIQSALDKCPKSI